MLALSVGYFLTLFKEQNDETIFIIRLEIYIMGHFNWRSMLSAVDTFRSYKSWEIFQNNVLHKLIVP